MKHVLQKIVKYLAYSVAAAVILLAIAVGVFRLMLPKLPEYQEQIKNWASAAIGMQVEFSGMDARWRLSGPELNFYDARLITREGDATLVNAREISVGVGLARLLLDRELVVDRVLVYDTDVDVIHEPGDGWRIQGYDLAGFLGTRSDAAAHAGPLTIVGEGIRINLREPARDLAVTVDIESINFDRDARQRSIDASLRLPPDLGNRLQIAASQRSATRKSARPWQFFIEGSALNAAGLAGLWPGEAIPVKGGTLDLSLWLEISAQGIRRATANFVVNQVAAGEPPDYQPVSASGRLEFARHDEEWLVAADDFVLRTPQGQWPQTSLQVRLADASASAFGRIEVSASYLDLDDWRHVVGWIPEPFRRQLAETAPSGVLRDVSFSMTRSDTAAERFDLAADLERAGLSAVAGRPGFRGFSGSLRADQSGGRLEIDARDLLLDLSAYLPQPVALQRAAGTIIWRRGSDGTTVLSDSVRLQNADFDSESSLQVTLPADGSSPVVDLHGNWSVSDISTVPRYLPERWIKPALYRWLGSALVGGTVSSGSVRFVGAIDRFPFDEGDGVFRIEAHLVDATLRYAENWPAAQIAEVDANLENMRLWTESNVVSSLGNRATDAQVEIRDLRDPVLQVSAAAQGTMETIRDFSRQSPIASLFGGQLDQLRVHGDAPFDLQLTYPILDRDAWDFTTVVHPRDGSVQFDGFPAPVTQLDGAVTIRRDSLHADALTGRFLGNPVDIELARIDDPAAEYSVVAQGSGHLDASDLVRDLGMPLGGLVEGDTDYRLSIHFPRIGQEPPVPVRIDIESDLSGMAVRMPEPAAKSPGVARPLATTIEFPARNRIVSTGSLADEMRWSLDFERTAAGWDFDRGALAVGGSEPGVPESRGLHIHGQTPVVDIGEWLDLARKGGQGPGFGERIRSIDLVTDDLYVIGQHLSRHRFILNRSALDWAVQIDGEQAVGMISIPYDLDGPRPIVLDMKTLTLPGGDDEKSATRAPLADPRTLPEIRVTAEQFSLGARHLGSLQADFRKTANGLEAGSFNTDSRSFDVSGRAGWVVATADPAGQRSYLAGKLTSSDVDVTMEQLDYRPGIESEAMDVRFDVSWSGGPKEDFLSSLDGDVQVRFGTGQLDEVEPGAGRVFGLMSIVALPRRLSLDFRDVFERGFVFDEITGSFRLQDGEAFTCDLSLKGPAADVGIVGRTGLVAKDYDQAAVVSANVGNTLPVVGAVVAGPQIAAALLIFSQIFKKPLQEMGQIYYGIDGSWSHPEIDAANAQRFAEASALAGCIGASE